MFTLRFSTDNAAFSGDRDLEVSRILQAVARKIEVTGEDNGKVFDLNGNNVGTWRITGKVAV